MDEENLTFTTSSSSNKKLEKVNLENINSIFTSFRKTIATQFQGIPVKIDNSLEGFQYYIAVSPELSNQIQEEADNTLNIITER